MIQIKNVVKRYGNKEVLKKINLNVDKGELITLLGPSGCGKTTLLKLINKLILADEGNILVNGKDIRNEDTIKLRRSIGYAVQQIGLFPHMNIEDNITYVLSLEKNEKKDSREIALKLIDKMGLDRSYLKRFPNELSGGEKQRIGVARAFAGGQNIILMDEPFGAVDELQKAKLQDDLLKMQKEEQKTIMFVTHDIFEAFKLGNRVVLMNDGEIQQVGTPKELLVEPKNSFVENFLGTKGFLATLKTDDIKVLRKYLVEKENI